MPADFERCANEKGSRMITKKVGTNKYIHICYDSSGKSHAGEVKTTKSKED